MLTAKQNILNEKEKVPFLELILITSLLTNICCLFHIQQQNMRINELIEKNNSLTNSINKLNIDLLKLGENIAVMNSKSLPIIMKNEFMDKPLLFLGVMTFGLGVSYFMSSTILTKMSALSLPKFLSIPKFISFSSMISNLPFFEQSKQLTVVIEDISTIFLIRIYNNNIESISFRHIDDENFTPIVDALRVYYNNKDPLLISDDRIPTLILLKKYVDGINGTVDVLSQFF